MRNLAVVLDLFGTLAHNFSRRGYEEALAKAADTLHISPQEFSRAWFATVKKRKARRPDTLSCQYDVQVVCAELGVVPSPAGVERAVRARLDYIQEVMTPRKFALRVLGELRQAGFPTALLSNCTHEVPFLWPNSPLAPLMDTAIFSAVEGIAKPEPQIYQTTAQRLNFKAKRCLFVGDGGSNELSGAVSAGMLAVLFRPDHDSSEPHLQNRERWNGPVLKCLTELPAMAAMYEATGTTVQWPYGVKL
eukprot:g59209.t1